MTITQFLQDLMSDVQALIGSAFVLVGLVIAILVSVRGKGSIGSVVMGIIVGGLIAAMGVIVITTSSMFKQEVNRRATGPDYSHVRVIDAAGPSADPLVSRAGL